MMQANLHVSYHRDTTLNDACIVNYGSSKSISKTLLSYGLAKNMIYVIYDYGDWQPMYTTLLLSMESKALWVWNVSL